MLIRLFFILGITLFATTAMADCASWGCEDVLVEELYINANGDVYVATDGDEQILNCTTVSGGGTLVTLRMSDSNAREIFSALLAAQRAQETVQIRISENSTGCNIAYIRSFS